MKKHAPGVYSIMNPYGKDTNYGYIIDNMTYELMGDTIVTVNVFDWAYFHSNIYVNKIANHPKQITGNSGYHAG